MQRSDSDDVGRRDRIAAVSVWVLAVSIATASAASAQAGPDDATRATARQLGEQGIHAYEANDFVTAAAQLDRAYRLFHVPTLGLWSARAHQQLGHWVEAAERYRDTIRRSEPAADNPAQRSAQRDAAGELEALLPRIPSLTIQIEQSDAAAASVTLDGVEVSADMLGISRPTNPGTHQLVAQRGDERIETTIQLLERDAKVVPFTWTPAAPSALSPPSAATLALQPKVESSTHGLRVASIALLAAGGVGLATSGIAMLVAKSKLEHCPDHVCVDDAAKSAYDSAKTATTIAFYLGTACAVAGVVTWFIEPSSEHAPAPALSWGVAPNGVALRGMF